MENIFIPGKVEYQQADKKNKNKAIIIIEPCYPGYGITWGNALRRVMLSSLPGAAINIVKIHGVKHEFSTLPGIKEDILQIILNLKSLRFKILKADETPVLLKIKIVGEKKVTAGDFGKNSDIEIVNPDQYVATLTEKKSSLEISAEVIRGYGYISSEEKDRANLELGSMLVDSVFTPIVRVGYRVENVRVGKRTDYDKLIIDLETDGTITPTEAFKNSAKMLADQFNYIGDYIDKQNK
ncbi:MAG: DNA-directed RNA polymerase subunit alpha [Patescibacteria group bacterium]